MEQCLKEDVVIYQSNMPFDLISDWLAVDSRFYRLKQSTIVSKLFQTCKRRPVNNEEPLQLSESNLIELLWNWHVRKLHTTSAGHIPRYLEHNWVSLLEYWINTRIKATEFANHSWNPTVVIRWKMFNLTFLKNELQSGYKIQSIL